MKSVDGGGADDNANVVAPTHTNDAEVINLSVASGEDEEVVSPEWRENEEQKVERRVAKWRKWKTPKNKENRLTKRDKVTNKKSKLASGDAVSKGTGTSKET